MAAIVWTDVTDLAPELSTIPLGGQTAILALVNDYLDPDTWGGEDAPKLHSGRCYLAAHLATLGKRKGKSGSVSSEAAGGLSRSYAMPAMLSTSTLQLTSYGAMYILLAKSTVARAGLSLNGGAKVPTDTGWDG